MAQGSAEPPRLIVITLHARRRSVRRLPCSGSSAKALRSTPAASRSSPPSGMEKMKYDMAGGAAMIGAMRAIAQLKPKVKVIAIVPATENMPGGKARNRATSICDVRQDDRSDQHRRRRASRARRRDFLREAARADASCDAATLTGAIVVALANVNVGVFGQPTEFLERLLESSRAVGEKMWPMPLDDEYADMIKSSIADIRNTGSGKGGGAITAAMFLKEFAEDMPWIHLDIAATTWSDDGKPWAAKGPTGIAIRSLIDLAMKM